MTKEELMEMGEEKLLGRATLAEIFEEEDAFDREELMCAARERAKQLRKKSEFESLAKAFKRDFGKRMGSLSNHYEYRGFDYDCGAWTIGSRGVTTLTDRGLVTACAHPVLPVRRMRNIQTQEEKITLAFLRDGRWHDITVGKDVVASNSKIVQLAKNSVLVTTENARDLVRYISDIESRNDIPLDTSTSKFGWVGDRDASSDFIPFDKGVTFDAEGDFRDLVASISRRGSEDEWMRETLDIRSRTDEHWETQLLMAASFASILVGPLDMQPFILNIYNKTGVGKTVSLMAATSVWADPEKGRYMTEALSTTAAFEARLSLLNDLPLALDDFSKVRKNFNDDLTDLVYMLASGRGRDRSNVKLGLQEVKTWQNVILSNMERPLWEFIKRGGGRNRVLEIPMGAGDVFPDGNRTAETYRANYGFAGPKFVRAAQGMGNAALKAMHKSIRDEVRAEADRQGKKPSERQVMALALVLMGDRISEGAIFGDGRLLDLPKFTGFLKDEDDIGEEQRAYETLMGLIQANERKFEPNLPPNYGGQVWGKIDEPRGLAHIYPVVLTGLADQYGFSKEMLLRWARDAGRLKCVQGKLTNRAKVSPGKTSVVHTFLLPDEGSGEWEEVDAGGDPDLPFPLAGESYPGQHPHEG